MLWQEKGLYLFPPFRHDTKVSNESPAGKSIGGVNSSSLADTTLVASTNPVAEKADPPPTLHGPFVIPVTEDTPTNP